MIKGSKQWIDAQKRLNKPVQDTIIPNCMNKPTCGICLKTGKCIEDL